jgi:hypothetical protein
MKNEDRNALFMLYNSPCHPKESQLTNVKVVLLPHNRSSKLQPLDHGIIQSFTLFYRHCILSALVARIYEAENIESFKKINLSDAVDWIKLAWDSVRENPVK